MAVVHLRELFARDSPTQQNKFMYSAGTSPLEMSTLSGEESDEQKRISAQYLREVHHVERRGARREVRDVDGHAHHVDVVVAEALQQEEELGAQAVEGRTAPAHLQFTRRCSLQLHRCAQFRVLVH